MLTQGQMASETILILKLVMLGVRVSVKCWLCEDTVVT
jgi:hypothetical protein